MKQYDINQVSLMTGLTTRTLRNYMQMGILNGYKEAGKWFFTEEELTAMFESSFVKQELEIKERAQVRKFMERMQVDEPSGCLVYDLPGEKQKVQEYCNQLMECFNQQYAVEGNRLNYTYDEKKKAGRFVLSGDASMIQKMLAILQES